MNKNITRTDTPTELVEIMSQLKHLIGEHEHVLVCFTHNNDAVITGDMSIRELLIIQQNITDLIAYANRN